MKIRGFFRVTLPSYFALSWLMNAIGSQMIFRQSSIPPALFSKTWLADDTAVSADFTHGAGSDAVEDRTRLRLISLASLTILPLPNRVDFLLATKHLFDRGPPVVA